MAKKISQYIFNNNYHMHLKKRKLVRLVQIKSRIERLKASVEKIEKRLIIRAQNNITRLSENRFDGYY